MTKSEWLSALAAKCFWTGTAVEDTEVGTNTGNVIRKYDVPVFMVDTSTGKGAAAIQSFYVFDEGGPGEAAYTAGNDRKSVPAFVKQLDDFLATKIGTGPAAATIRKIKKDTVEADDEFAIVTVYFHNTTTDEVSTDRYFVAKVAGAPFFAKFTG